MGVNGYPQVVYYLGSIIRGELSALFFPKQKHQGASLRPISHHGKGRGIVSLSEVGKGAPDIFFQLVLGGIGGNKS